MAASSSSSSVRQRQPTAASTAAQQPQLLLQEEQEQQEPPPPPPQRSALSRALTSTANLANLLPTGTLLAFNLLAPTFTNHGACDATTALLTRGLLAVLALSCALASFTDSLRGPDGRVYFFESRLCPISIGKRKYRRFTPEGDTRKRGKEADRNAQEF